MDLSRLLSPRSIAIVGMSTRPGSAGQVILQSLKLNKFAGDIHLVGRSAEPTDGRPVLKSAEELPAGVDLAVFTLPAAAVRDAVADCVKSKVGSAMIFAAGFAEVGAHDEDLLILFHRRHLRAHALLGPPGSAMATHLPIQTFR